jgi:hypothetical protein
LGNGRTQGDAFTEFNMNEFSHPHDLYYAPPTSPRQYFERKLVFFVVDTAYKVRRGCIGKRWKKLLTKTLEHDTIMVLIKGAMAEW